MFKKICLGLAALSYMTSFTASALPSPTSEVIQATMRHPAFLEAFKAEQYFEKVSFEAASRYDYEAECKNYSRSGSVIKVTFTKTYPEVSESVYLFTTDGNPSYLEPCEG